MSEAGASGEGAESSDTNSEKQIKWNVTGGVVEIPKNKTVTLMYTVPDRLPRITWEWCDQKHPDGSTQHVAKMIAWDSKRGHKSKPIPEDTFKRLGTPKKSRENKYFKVEMSRQNDSVSIEEYFNK